MTVPWNATLSVEDLTRWGIDPTKAHAVSGVLCSALLDGRPQVLLLPVEPLVDASVDRVAYAEEHATHAIRLEPAEAFVDVLERQVPGMLTGGLSAVMYFQPAVVRGVVRREADGGLGRSANRFVMTVESGTVCELGTYRLWDFVVSSSAPL